MPGWLIAVVIIGSEGTPVHAMRTLFAPSELQPGAMELAAAEAHHGRTVLRLSRGQHCRVIDGLGHQAEAEVVAVSRHGLRVELAKIGTIPPPRARALQVALAAPKGARLEEVVRGLVELGVGTIAILGCERASRLPNVERLERIAREALKQSQAGYMPGIELIADLATWRPRGRLVMLDPRAQALSLGPPQVTTLVIGAEGGLSPPEEAGLLALGAERMRLTSTILRIETAAIAATAVWAHSWEHYV